MSDWKLDIRLYDNETHQKIVLEKTATDEVVRWMMHGAVLEFHGKRISGAIPRVDIGTRTVTIRGELL